MKIYVVREGWMFVSFGTLSAELHCMENGRWYISSAALGIYATADSEKEALALVRERCRPKLEEALRALHEDA